MKPSARLKIILGVLEDCKISSADITLRKNIWDDDPETKALSTVAWVKLPDSDIRLSIQTHPIFTGKDTPCETVLIGGKDQSIIYVKDLGYQDVVWHQTADDFKQDLMTLMSQVKGKKLADMTVAYEPIEDDLSDNEQD